MLTVLRTDGLRVTIYLNDRRPAHVHVIGDGKEVVFDLNCPKGPPVVRVNYGFSRREVGRIGTIREDALRDLCGDWEKIHGRF